MNSKGTKWNRVFQYGVIKALTRIRHRFLWEYTTMSITYHPITKPYWVLYPVSESVLPSTLFL